ncbi:LmeA family phospholipid-binding protein [Arthrobacter sp. H5]|uniref:LmeA family phospholipid-binding protein n=1 Tax=Arthrobacter sp. H5 TaxID=1267973 RepID=UPI00048824CA|nr:LmeA family phospholipid-binding protein [Arthrobacter sp. H5]
MDWTRAKDWLIGATGMVLVLGVAVAILWWVVSDPAGGVEAGPVPSPTVGAEGPPNTEPPADLREDEVWFADLALDAGTVVTAGSMLRDVRAVGQDVVTGPDGLVAQRLAVDATVPFGVVTDELGDGTVVRAADGGQAMVIRTVEALGRELRVVATGTVEVEAGRLVIEPRSIDVGGPDFLSDAIAAVVRRLVTIEHDIEGLPDGLVLQDVTVQGDGFRANLRGEDVKLVP